MRWQEHSSSVAAPCGKFRVLAASSSGRSEPRTVLQLRTTVFNQQPNFDSSGILGWRRVIRMAVLQIGSKSLPCCVNVARDGHMYEISRIWKLPIFESFRSFFASRPGSIIPHYIESRLNISSFPWRRLKRHTPA